MNILQYTPAYLPSIGGLEFVVRSLARALVELGHASRILALQDGSWGDDAELGVLRYPGVREQAAALKWADFIICHQDALSLAWILPVCRKPVLMMINVTPQRRSWPLMFLMRFIVSRCHMQASSRFLALEVNELFGVACGVLPNPYNPAHFYRPPSDAERQIDFAFVGRLVELKGADVLIGGLARLAAKGVRPRVSIIGDGTERCNVEHMIEAHGLGGHVTMLGQLHAEQIGDVLRRARCLVVPSRYEPFGIVALEGRACGCDLIVTSTGGLLEAAGSGATVVPPGDVEAMADALLQILQKRGVPDALSAQKSGSDPELQKHEPNNVALAYLSVLGFRGGEAGRVNAKSTDV